MVEHRWTTTKHIAVSESLNSSSPDLNPSSKIYAEIEPAFQHTPSPTASLESDWVAGQEKPRFWTSLGSCLSKLKASKRRFLKWKELQYSELDNKVKKSYAKLWILISDFTYSESALLASYQLSIAQSNGNPTSPWPNQHIAVLNTNTAAETCLKAKHQQDSRNVCFAFACCS